MATTYEITLVDGVWKGCWPKAADLLKLGVPLSVAALYEKERRRMSRAGLRLQLRHRVN